MSNIYRSGDEKKNVFVIDSNDRINQRLNEYREELLRKKEEENKQRLDEFLEGLEYDEEGKPIIPVDEEGYYILPLDEEGYPLVSIDEEGNLELPSEEENETEDNEDFESSLGPEDIEANIEKLLEDARMQADAIIQEAESRSEAMLEHAKEEGRKEGYNEGVAQGVAEYNEKEAQLEAERQQMLAQLNEARETMEGELVDIICDVVERAFKVKFEESKEIILHLVDKVLINANGSKTFIIRVSEKNQKILNDNKESLLERLGSDALLDIITDPLMDDESCMIETDGGVFNCGIDIQLSALLRDLRLLSIQP